MIAECDFSQLEWRVAAELSRDPVMIQEILDNVDVHTRTGEEHFKGKGDRSKHWKAFNFRMIYADERTTAFAFYADGNMPNLSKKEWTRIVESFYLKYGRFAQWHIELYKEVMNNHGKLVMPSGRTYQFGKIKRGDYNRAQIYNYPVQGCAGGEILPLALVAMRRAILDTPIKIVNTVHDSIIFDLPDFSLDKLKEIWYNTLRELPTRYKKLFGMEWLVPLDGEMKVGPSWGELEKCTLH